jgi:thiol-disulfide isomerase/thioredoxin
LPAAPNTKAPPSERGDAVGVTALVLFVLVGGFMVFAFAWALGPAVEKQGQAACVPLQPEPRNETAPEFVGQDLAGNPVSLADLHGKFVIVNFWATYCEPCTKEWPQLDRLAHRFAERDDVVVVAVSIDTDKALIEPYLQQMGLSETNTVIWWDSSGEGNANVPFGSEKIPDTFFVDESGELISAFINVREWGKPGAFRCVESMVRG